MLREARGSSGPPRTSDVWSAGSPRQRHRDDVAGWGGEGGRSNSGSMTFKPPLRRTRRKGPRAEGGCSQVGSHGSLTNLLAAGAAAQEPEGPVVVAHPGTKRRRRGRRPTRRRGLAPAADVRAGHPRPLISGCPSRSAPRGHARRRPLYGCAMETGRCVDRSSKDLAAASRGCRHGLGEFHEAAGAVDERHQFQAAAVGVEQPRRVDEHRQALGA